MVADFVDRADVGVVERRGQPGLALDACACRRVVAPRGRDDFQRHGATQPCVLGTVDPPFPPAPSSDTMR
jgi:hypothetical protein